jgi:hypothetical protein
MVREFPSPGKLSVVLLLAGLALGGCAAGGDESDPNPGSGESDLTSLSVTLEGSGKDLAVEDRPRLKAQAEGALTCGADRFAVDGRVRVTCTRGDELLEVIVRDGNGLLVHKPVRRSDKETFFACTTSGSGPDGLPKKLQCKNAPLRDRPSHGGGLASPFDSTVPGITIPNSHVVGGNPKLLRGMAPGSPEEFDQLFAADVGAVLVFKNKTTQGHSVDEEIATLIERGLPESQAKNIEFKWKEIGPFKTPCEQVVEGLKFLKTNLAAGRKTLFHCTVGEDRTGFLGAMHRLLNEDKLEATAAWDGEMCERGYGAGNPLKPGFVVGQLESSLKPLYQKMAYLAAKGQLDRLDPAVCATDPESAPDFAEVAPPIERLTCGTSTLFVP